MTKKRKNNSSDIPDKSFQKLSIQVSLNGLSFCVADTVSHKIVYSDYLVFPEELNIVAVQDQLDKLVKKHQLHQKQFDHVTVVHRNTLFGLVPKALFDANSLSDYLKFNTRIFPTDSLAYDELEHQDIINVYVPYANINNYIYDIFGEFTFFHNGTILIQSLLNGYGNQKDTICYAHVSKNQLDICVVAHKNLLLYNSFLYETKEDFAYYLLFVLEQLELDNDQVPVKLFGAIEEDHAVFKLCRKYIKKIIIFTPSSPQYLQLGEPEGPRIDFTVLNTL
ncbi:DUF3822 family protein [Maribacter chungangensis]|uniref:DUF3822 family protein n=1 Tax=Maribacter chungangensis TaxID=1069117 RepID=A0ABW3B289_9FLAO